MIMNTINFFKNNIFFYLIKDIIQLMKSKDITQEYLRKRIFEIDRKSNQEYYIKDGIKTLKNGHWEYLYDDGSLSGKGTYIDGVATGAWQLFYPNGKLSQRGFYYSNGKRVSKYEYGDTWEYYDEDGNLEDIFNESIWYDDDQTLDEFYASLGPDFLKAIEEYEDDE